MKKILPAILAFVLAFAAQKSNATHLMGADLTYECLGSGQYKLTLKVYRDCRGVDAGSFQSVSYKSTQCNVTSSVSMQLVTGFPRDITPTCPGQSSVCQNGNLPYGVQEFVYQGTVTLPPGCGNDWVFGWTSCCRNNAINTLTDPGSNDMYVTTTIDNTLSPCNSSPIFTVPPVPFTCINQPVSFNPGGTDLDGDSLAFSFATPQQTTGNVTYKNPYNVNNPLSTTGGITINPTNGDVNFTPNQTQVAVIAVQIKEYRNGQLISTIVRDIQYTIINCSNQNPTASGINGTSNTSTSIYAGQNICFDVNSNDADAGDVVTMNWDQSIPGATFTPTSANHPTGTFCWQTTQADTGTHIFTVTVKDNNCPITGQGTRSYTIVVLPCPQPPAVGGPDVSLCPGQTTTLSGSTTAPPGNVQSYVWGDGVTTHNGQTWAVNPVQTTVYTFSVTYTDGCVKTDQVLVKRSVTPSVTVFPANATLCAGASIQLTATTNGAVTQKWFPSAGLNCDTCKVVVASPTNSTVYKVVAYNVDGCPSDTAIVNITSSPPPPPQSCQVIYATPTGTGSGGMADPTNLKGAIAKAQCNNALIKLAVGTYTIDSAITNISSYTTMEGGHDPTTWTKTSTPGATRIYRSALNMEGATFAEKRLVAIYMNSQSYFRFQDITFETADCPALLPADSSGYSNYVFHITNCSNYDFVRCQITPGKATGGRNGVNGVGLTGTGGVGGAGANGNPNTGCDLVTNAGTAGTAGSNGGGAGGAGGVAAIGDGCNIFGCGADAMSGGNGGNGIAGVVGTDGPATNPTAPTTTQFFQIGGKGIDGTNGSAGGGGGGGGGGTKGTDCTCSINGTPNGGSGGNGGNGGMAGTAGFGGGGCFAVYLFNNGAGTKFTDCDINTNLAGAGGAGGTGTAGTNGTAGAAGITTTGSCSSSHGGNGGNGGNGGKGGNGQPGANGASAGIVSNGIVPIVINGSTSQTINTGINNPTKFNLASQPTISATNTNCTYRNITFSSASTGAWNFGAGASPSTGNGASVTLQYTAFGRKDISYSSNIYTGFTIIPIDANSYVPDIDASATRIGASDTFVLCQGQIADFYGVIPGADSFFWDFGGALAVNTYAGPQYDEVLGLKFNTPGIFKVKMRISTSCCGYSPYDSVYVWVDPYPILAFNGYLGYCPGDSATITATGAVRYEWTPPTYLSSTTAATVVAKPPTNFNYFLTGYSASGLCVADTFFEVVVKPPPTLSFVTTPATCGPTGTIKAVPNPTGSYVYAWQSPIADTDSFVTGLGVGGYNVTVTDNSTGCTAIGNGVIGAGSGLTAYIDSLTPVLCAGACNGTIRVAGIGGSGNNSFAWSSGQATRAITGLCPGKYTVTVTDLSSNCTAIASGDIFEPQPIVPVLLDTTGTTCPSACDGAATVDASGGTGTMTVVWALAGNPTGNTRDSLCAGPTKAYMVDANNCIDSLEFIIPGPPASTFIDSVITNVSCFGGNNGAIDITISGQSGPWTTTWNNGALAEDIANLAAGCYTVTVHDITNCAAASATICVKEPAQLAVTDSTVNIACNGETNGCIYLKTSGGTPNYSFAWLNTTADSTACNLAAGSYSVTVTDANSCTATLQNINITEPTPLALSVATTPVSCKDFSDGTVAATASGGTPTYHYNWNPANADSSAISGLVSGLYNLTVTDSRGCTIDTQNIFVNELPGITLMPLVMNVLCPPLENGAIYMVQTGAIGNVTYQWSNGALTQDITSLPSGTYSVTVSDSRNCKADTTLEVLNDSIFKIYASPNDTFIPLGGKVKIEVTNSPGTQVASYVYRPNQYLSCGNCATTIASPLASMPYVITGIDTNGCVWEDTVNITVIPDYPVFVPNAFSPGGNDNRNAFFELYGNKDAWKQMHIQIFNRWGEKVYDTYDKNFKWDGMYNGQYLPGGVYVYSLKITWIDNYSKNDFKGSITLLR